MDLLNLIQSNSEIIFQIKGPDLLDFANALSERSRPKPAPNSKHDIGEIEIAIEMTGLSKGTIYGKTSRNEIPHFKKGKKLYFSRKALTEWLQEGKVKTLSELEEEADAFLERKSKRK